MTMKPRSTAWGMERIGQLMLVAAMAGGVGAARALPQDERVNDKADAARPAPRPLAAPPKTSAPTLADTSALLPAGNYRLAITLRGETHAEDALIARTGGALTVALSDGARLQGSLLPDGTLQLQGTGNNNALKLTGAVSQRRGAGQVHLARGAQSMAGRFTLDPQTGARKLREYEAPKTGGAASDCGFFCRMGKAWECLSNWSKC
jgi:hypothetical protein